MDVVIKTVGIRELKNKLSAYLQEVRRGIRILITDRNRVVAELREPLSTSPAADAHHPLLAQWIREGSIRLPTAPLRPMRKSSVRMPAGTAKRLIDEDRGE